MERKLQRCLSSLEQLSNIYNLDANNPIRFSLEHPVTKDPYLLVASVVEPHDVAGLPLNAIWIVLNPVNLYYKKALKYKGSSHTDQLDGFSAAWIEIHTYADIFSEPQTAGVGTVGPKGPIGDTGLAGPAGDAGPLDYPAIIAQCVSLVNQQLLVPVSLVITGTNNIVEGQTSQLTATVTYQNNTTANVSAGSTWSVDNAVGTVNQNGLFTGQSVSADSTCTVTASYTNMGATVQATYNMTVRDALPVSLTVNGASNVNENSSSSYTATVSWSNGTSSNVSATWSVSNGAMGSINSSGVLTTASVAANVLGNVQASYTYGATTVNGSKAVTVVNVPTVVYPYYGVANMNLTKNEAFILALSNRGPTANRIALFTLDAGDAGSGLKMYFAYPVSYGEATFTDTSNGFQGGWDGVTNDPFNWTGPTTINVTVDGLPVPFYLYGTDFDGIGVVQWSVS